MVFVFPFRIHWEPTFQYAFPLVEDFLDGPERRERKLLLKRHEIFKLKSKITKDGYSLIPLKLYFKNNKAKILIGLAKGKKTYDKRESIKKKDIERQKKARYIAQSKAMKGE